MVEAYTDSEPNRLWPTCDDGEVQVMLLGTYHMANPGLDEVNVEADDLLSARRQRELANVADRFVEWAPDRVGVEDPVEEQRSLSAEYESYRSGQRAYDRDWAASSEDEQVVAPRSEVVQLGFRIADRLGQETVTAVDEHPDRSRYEPDPFEDRSVDSTRKTSTELPDPADLAQERRDRLTSSTVSEYLTWLNQETQLLISQELMFDQALRLTDETFGSPLALTLWYERNIRILHHIWRTMESDDERLLLVFGSGHITVLRHLLTESPMFCPVSPLAFLPSLE